MTRIANFKKISGTKMRAMFAAVLDNGIMVKNMGLCHSEQRGWYIVPPMKSFTGRQGKEVTFSLVVLPPNLQAEVQEAALVKYNEAQA